jgi:hypothetical protein
LWSTKQPVKAWLKNSKRNNKGKRYTRKYLYNRKEGSNGETEMIQDTKKENSKMTNVNSTWLIITLSINGCYQLKTEHARRRREEDKKKEKRK